MNDAKDMQTSNCQCNILLLCIFMAIALTSLCSIDCNDTQLTLVL